MMNHIIVWFLKYSPVEVLLDTHLCLYPLLKAYAKVFFILTKERIAATFVFSGDFPEGLKKM